MKQLIGGRGTGKTTKLIYQSAWSGAVIITATDRAAGYIEYMAKQLHLDIPKPMSILEAKQNRGALPQAVLIDELDAVISQMLAPVYRIEGYSISLEDKNDGCNKGRNE